MKPYLIREVVWAYIYILLYVCMMSSMTLCMYTQYHTAWYIGTCGMIYDLRVCTCTSCFDSILTVASHRVVQLLSTLPVSMVTQMWWTISSGQEPVSTWPTQYGDCTTQCSVFSVHSA